MWNKGQGTFNADGIESVWLDVTANGNGNVVVGFSVDNQTVYWTGFLSEKTKAKTLATIARLGYRESSLINIAESDAPELLFDFPLGKVNVVVEEEHYEKEGESKSYHKVKWVNIDGYGESKKGMKRDDIYKNRKAFAFDGELAKFQSEVSVNQESNDGMPF